MSGRRLTQTPLEPALQLGRVVILLMRRVDARLHRHTDRGLVARDADGGAALARPVAAVPAVGLIDVAGPVDDDAHGGTGTAFDRVIDDRVIDHVAHDPAAERLASAV